MSDQQLLKDAESYYEYDSELIKLDINLIQFHDSS